MSSHEKPDNLNDFGFGDWDEVLDPETERLLDELRVPVKRPPARAIARELTEDLFPQIHARLRELAVEGVDQVSKANIRSVAELQMTPYILDDVHYVVYSAKKRGPDPIFRYVTVDATEVFAEFRNMQNTGANSVILQRRQNHSAQDYLADTLKVDYDDIEVTGSTRMGRFAIRSLYRLLNEESMRSIAAVFPRAARERIDSRPLMFDEVALRATDALHRKIESHRAIDFSSLSADQRTHYRLIARDLARVRAFGVPVRKFLSDLNPNIDPPSSESALP